MKRENGFYWVNYKGEWIVGQWDENLWWIPAADVHFNNDEFIEIDERMIVRPLLRN